MLRPSLARRALSTAPPVQILFIDSGKVTAEHYLLVPGGGLRSISVGTAIDRAPFLPTARTAKK